MGQLQSILIILTSFNTMPSNEPTGIWLEEFAIPYNEFIDKGFKVTVASIQGGQVPIDPRSKPTAEQQTLWAGAIEVLDKTTPIASVQHDLFDAVFLPGGHGTMFDLPGNRHLQTILRDFAEQSKVIAAVCHGPAGFVDVRLKDGTALVEGKTLTSFTNDEESAAGLTEKMPFLLEDRLKALGAKFVAQPNWSDHVQVDGILITGQNPQSSKSIALAVINMLTDNKGKKNES